MWHELDSLHYYALQPAKKLSPWKELWDLASTTALIQ